MFRVTGKDGVVVADHDTEKMANEIAKGYVASTGEDATVTPLKLNTKTGELEPDEKKAKNVSPTNRVRVERGTEEEAPEAPEAPSDTTPPQKSATD